MLIKFSKRPSSNEIKIVVFLLILKKENFSVPLYLSNKNEDKM